MIKWLCNTLPVVGSVWGFRDEILDPFKDPAVIVMAVKDGFVKYCWYWARNHEIFSGDSCSVRMFRSMYRERT